MDEGFGMTAFTQAALVELKKREVAKDRARNQQGKAAGGIDRGQEEGIPKSVQTLLRKLDGAKYGTKGKTAKTPPPMAMARKSAIALVRSKSQISNVNGKDNEQQVDPETRKEQTEGAPQARKMKRESTLEKLLSTATSSDTLHHQHHLHRRQMRIQQLEHERVAAAEAAAAETLRQEKAKERRLERLYKAKQNSLFRIEEELIDERDQLRAEHELLKHRHSTVSINRVPAAPHNPAEFGQIGSRVCMKPLQPVLAYYSREGIPLPPRDVLDLITSRQDASSAFVCGVVVGQGSLAPIPNYSLIVRFDQFDQVLDLPVTCLRLAPTPEGSKCPTVVTAKGQSLVLAGLNVTVEVFGDLAHVTHRSDWQFESFAKLKAVQPPKAAVAKDKKSTSPDVRPSTTSSMGSQNTLLSSQLHKFAPENVAIIAPQDPMMTLASVSADVGDSKLRSAVLTEAYSERMKNESQDRREARQRRQQTSAEGERAEQSGVLPAKDTSSAPRHEQHDATHMLSSGDVSDDDNIMQSDGVWQDVFQVNNHTSTIGGRTGNSTVIIPLKEAKCTDTVHIELRYIMDAKVYVPAAEPNGLFGFTIPCEQTEQSLGPLKLEDASSFQAVVCGFGQRGVRLDTHPATKLQKCAAFTGTRPNFTVATKTGPWKNSDAQVLFAPERTEEVNVQCLTEGNQSSLNADTFMVLLTPLAPLNFDLTFKRIVNVVVEGGFGTPELKCGESAILQLLSSLLPGDLLTIIHLPGAGSPARILGAGSTLTTSDLVSHTVGALSSTSNQGSREALVGLELKGSGEEWRALVQGFFCPRPSEGEDAFDAASNSESSEDDLARTARSSALSPTPITTHQSLIKITSTSAAIISCFEALGIFAQRAKRAQDCVRELVVLSQTPLSTQERGSIVGARSGNAYGVRCHTCFSGDRQDSTGLFLRTLSARSRGHSCHAWLDHTRHTDVGSFVARLGRPLVIDLEVSFINTHQSELPNGAPDLCAGIPLAIPGRYQYTHSDHLSDHATLSGRFPKGRILRRRLVNARLTLPITKLLMPKFLSHTLGTALYERAQRFHQVTTQFASSLASNAPNPLTTPATTSNAPDPEVEVYKDACQFNFPLPVYRDPPSPCPSEAGENPNEERSQVETTLIATESLPSASERNTGAEGNKPLPSDTNGPAIVHVFQLQPIMDQAMGTSNAFPPVVGTPSPGLVPPGGAKHWCEYVAKKAEKCMIECGTFASVNSTGGCGEGADASLGAQLGTWIPKSVVHYECQVGDVQNQESRDRDTLDSEEWTGYLECLQTFHEHRITILLRAVQLTCNMSVVEEEHRRGYYDLTDTEKKDWKEFLESTSELRVVMDRLNVFAYETRRRISYSEEDSRNAIMDHQKVQWTLTQLVACSVQAPVTISSVETTLAACKAFMQDTETLNFVALMLAVWSLPPKKAEVIGLNGGITMVKSLLQLHGNDEGIVESLLQCIVNFAAVRTSHGKLETSNVVLEVMHALTYHTSCMKVQQSGVQCLATLSSLTQNFRQSIIVSPNGLSFVLTNYADYMSDPKYALAAFRFFNTAAKETTSHRRIIELALRPMWSTVLVLHSRNVGLRILLLKILGQLASSRGLRAELARMCGPVTVLFTVFSEACSAAITQDLVKMVKVALNCAESMCGNVGDFAAQTLSFSLLEPLNRLVRTGEGRFESSVIEIAHRLLCRLALCQVERGTQCESSLRPLFKPWSGIRLNDMVAEDLAFGTLYGAVLQGTLDCGGVVKPVMVRIFSRGDTAAFLDPPAEQELNGSEEEQVNAQLLEVEEGLHETLLGMQVQDVINNSFVSHPIQIPCLGFSKSDDFHCTLFDVPAPDAVRLDNYLLQKQQGNATPLMYAHWLDLAVSLLDVAALYEQCNAVHRDLSLGNIFIHSEISLGFEVQVGPSCPVTDDVVASCPTKGQHMFPEGFLATLAAETNFDDLRQIRFALLSMLEVPDIQSEDNQQRNGEEGGEEQIREERRRAALGRLPREVNERVFQNDTSSVSAIRSFLTEYRRTETGDLFASQPIKRVES